MTPDLFAGITCGIPFGIIAFDIISGDNAEAASDLLLLTVAVPGISAWGGGTILAFLLLLKSGFKVSIEPPGNGIRFFSCTKPLLPSGNCTVHLAFSTSK